MAFGVYVHIPFCATRCDYCAFATWTDRAHLVEAYVAACATEVHRRYGADDHPPATSVFFGGGTPSLLSADLLGRVLDAIPLAPGAEITVECNPDSVDRHKLDGYRGLGVNRISLGVQSMAPHVLHSLGRSHDPANVVRAVEWIREVGFPTFNVDLIYGAPGESVDDWRHTVAAVMAFDPPHVSAYALTVEPGTPFHQRVEGGLTLAPVDDDQAVKYWIADDALTEAGRSWYEISNWALPGHGCRHNRVYWEGGEFLGIGCAAHGFTGGRRWWNVRTPERYVAAVAEGRAPEAGSEFVTRQIADAEALMLGLRTRSGAPAPHGAEALAADLARAGVVEVRHGRVVLTRRGRLVANDITLRLLPARVSTQ